MALGSDQRLIAAHKKTVAAAVEELEAAIYRHGTSRELDPQIHTHAVVANLTYDGAEGRWKALQASGIYERRAYLTEVYRNVLAREARSLVFQVVNGRQSRGRVCGFEIQGLRRLVNGNSLSGTAVPRIATGGDEDAGATNSVISSSSSPREPYRPPTFYHGTPAANDAARDAHARRYTRLRSSPAKMRRSSTNAPQRAGASGCRVAMSTRCEEALSVRLEPRGPDRTAGPGGGHATD
jgi:hypothetical protein